MCGRFAQAIPLGKLKMTDLFTEVESDYIESYNVAPLHDVSVIHLKNGRRVMGVKKWGLVPSWAKDDKSANRLINARGETLKEKPSFRGAFRKKRCIVPVSGFYEWQSDAGLKRPYFVRMAATGDDFIPMLLAGLHESWKTPEGRVLDTFTIITTSSCDKLKFIHDRMPVILTGKDLETWFDHDLPPEEIERLVRPVDDELVEYYPVSELVNSPRNNSEKCMEKI